MKTKDPFKNLKLDAFEQSIENAFEKGEFKDITTDDAVRELKQTAKNSIALRENKEARINIRLKTNTLSNLRNKASELGMPYQTLASTVLHQFATGKFTLKIAP